MTKGAAKPAQPKAAKARRGSGAVAKQPRRPAKQAAAAAAAKHAAATEAAGMEAPAAAAAPAAGKPNRPPTAFESRLYAVCKCIPAGRVATYGVMAQVLGSAPRACGQVGCWVGVRPPAAACHMAAAAPFGRRGECCHVSAPGSQPALLRQESCTLTTNTPTPPSLYLSVAPPPQALRRNPFAPVVPCHRVIAASLDLGGFSGGWGMGCDSVHKKRRLLQEEGVRFDDRGKLLGSDAGAVMTAAELRAAAKGVL